MGALTFFVIAGEPSGDKLGAALMGALRQLHGDVRFVGVGGALMQGQGLRSLFPMQELSVMGIVEVLPKYRTLMRRVDECAAAALAANPAALITIDSPDFCLRVAAKVKSARPNLRTIHYVAPSVWAWRPKRAVKMARVIDHVLALLPIEPPLMQAAGMSCDFVGHPVVSDVLANPAEAAAFAGDGPLILCLPGSRRGEVARLAPIFGQVMARILAVHPSARAVLPTLDSVADLVRSHTQDWPIAPQIITDPAAKRGAFAAANVALAASGTVSLELAANACPMVIAYDMNRLTLWLMRRAALVDTVTLVNLVSDTRAVPEFIGANCRADLIAPALLGVLANPQAQRAAMEVTMSRLGRGGAPPALRAAQSVLAAI
jgi:lipid-A-disaccharide synthase